MEKRSLLQELCTILADYVQRIERTGAEALRLPGESRAAWVHKRKRIRLALKVLDGAASKAREWRELRAILADPGRLAAAAEKNLESLRRRVAAMDRARARPCASDYPFRAS